MTNPYRRAAAASLFALLLLPLPVRPAAAPAGDGHKRLIAETDLFRFVWVADPRISPDGSRIIFTRVTVDDEKEGYDTSLWIVPADGSEPPRAFTGGRHDASPRWSPDGRAIAFVRRVEKEGEEAKPQIYLIPATGGEAQALTDLPRGADSPAWSPDGKRIVFGSTTTAEDLAKKAKQEAKKKETAKGEARGETGEERESDVRVITRAVYRANGEGYLDPEHPSHLWLVAVPAPGQAAGSPEATPLTRGEFAEENPAWSRDGSRVYFTSDRVAEPYYGPDDSDLFSVPAAGGEPRLEASIDGTITDYAASPDGRSLAFIGSAYAKPVRSYDQADVFLASPAGGSTGPGNARNLTTGYDYEIGAGLSGDQHAPRGGQPSSPVVWSRDGKSVVVSSAERGRANLLRVDVGTGRTEPVTRGDHEVVSYSATPDASRFALVISTPVAIGDLWVLDAGAGAAGAGTALRQLSHFNDALFSELDLTPPEEINYKSFDGKEIQAWVQKPPSYRPGQKLPLILNIHGGPHAAYGYTFDHEFQWMAAKGYAVLYPNPRGSTTYGQDFANVIQFHYPGDDAKDLMAGVDELIRRGLVDPERQGVTGGSGGGILTNWIVTQTDRFKAAVAQRSIADWSGFWYTADFTLFIPSWFKAAPWEDPKDFAERSPITHVADVKTPLMLIEGEADARTPPTAGGEQMFRALKYLKKPAVMVRFPGETHELSRSGKPWHRIERLRHIVGWFDKYLQGKDSGAYGKP